GGCLENVTVAFRQKHSLCCRADRNWQHPRGRLRSHPRGDRRHLPCRVLLGRKILSVPGGLTVTEARPYTTQMSAGLGLVNETKTLLELWSPGMSTAQLFQVALDSGRFPTIT